MAADRTQTTDIPVRRPVADLANSGVDKLLVDDDPILSHVLAVLSAVFPNGEDFFVHSVRNYRDRIKDDPVLRARVKGFIGQEAMHGREHRAFNERLHELGYDTRDQDAALLRAAKWLHNRPEKVQLAVTAASEHATSVMAHGILSHQGTRDVFLSSHPDLLTLFAWHALEELEHKDVAFDLLQSVDDSYVLRLRGIAWTGLAFGTVIANGLIRAVIADWRSMTPRAATRASRNFLRQRMFGPAAWPHFLQYLRPGFHPRDLDTDALVEEWRERLAPLMVA